MLTASQVATAAYITEGFELLCPRCFDEGEEFAKPISRYELDEWQSGEAEGYEWSYDDERVQEFHQGCEPALCDVNGHELLEAWHDGHDEDDEPEVDDDEDE